MLKVVNNRYLKSKFDAIWKKVYEGCNYDYESESFKGDKEDVFRFVIQHLTKKFYVGTVEVVFNYQKNGKEYEDHYKYSELEELKNNLEKVCIIQKVCVKKEYQRDGYLSFILKGIFDVSNEKQLDYAVAFILPQLYVALKRDYGIVIYRPKGSELFEYKGDKTLPVVIDLAATKKKVEKGELRWFADLFQEKKNYVKM